MAGIDKMNTPQQTIQRAALTAVACNTMMLSVCDDLKTTSLYTHKRRQLINTLTADLEGFVKDFYVGLPEEGEMQYHQLIRTVEAGANVLATMALDEIPRFVAFWAIYRSGQFAEVDESKYEGLKRCGML